MFSKLGRFDIKEILGRGAMGEVYLGIDPVLGREVAIKTIGASALSEDQARKRFEREAKAAAILNHPNIVTIHEFGEDQGVLYIAMERLKGQDLEHLLIHRVLSLADYLEILAQVCDGLDIAHRSQIIHRDIKPSNVMVTREGRRLLVKLMDFGVARLKDSAMTMAGTVMGTVNYIAPEYIRNGEPDARSDLFAVGVMLYECISGKKPFDAGTASSVLYKIVNDPPDPLDLSMLQGLNPSLRNMTERALAKDPDDRYQTAEELALALRAAKDPAWNGRLEESTLRMKVQSFHVLPDAGAKPAMTHPSPLDPMPLEPSHGGGVSADSARAAKEITQEFIVPEALKASPRPSEAPVVPDALHASQAGVPTHEDIAAAKVSTREVEVPESLRPSHTVMLDSGSDNLWEAPTSAKAGTQELVVPEFLQDAATAEIPTLHLGPLSDQDALLLSAEAEAASKGTDEILVPEDLRTPVATDAELAQADTDPGVVPFEAPRVELPEPVKPVVGASTVIMSAEQLEAFLQEPKRTEPLAPEPDASSRTLALPASALTEVRSEPRLETGSMASDQTQALPTMKAAAAKAEPPLPGENAATPSAPTQAVPGPSLLDARTSGEPRPFVPAASDQTQALPTMKAAASKAEPPLPGENAAMPSAPTQAVPGPSLLDARTSGEPRPFARAASDQTQALPTQRAIESKLEPPLPGDKPAMASSQAVPRAALAEPASVEQPASEPSRSGSKVLGLVAALVIGLGLLGGGGYYAYKRFYHPAPPPAPEPVPQPLPPVAPTPEPIAPIAPVEPVAPVEPAPIPPPPVAETPQPAPKPKPKAKPKEAPKPQPAPAKPTQPEPAPVTVAPPPPPPSPEPPPPVATPKPKPAKPERDRK